eukprot:8768167-Heterocapsa_arctica.AAC.1
MDGVQPSLERFPERTSKDSQTYSIKLKGEEGGLLDLTPLLHLSRKKERKMKDNSDQLQFSLTFTESGWQFERARSSNGP